jgi:hypothetical protein
MCHVFLQDKFDMPLDVHLLTLDSSLHNANANGNTHHHYKEKNKKMKSKLIAK